MDEAATQRKDPRMYSEIRLDELLAEQKRTNELLANLLVLVSSVIEQFEVSGKKYNRVNVDVCNVVKVSND